MGVLFVFELVDSTDCIYVPIPLCSIIILYRRLHPDLRFYISIYSKQLVIYSSIHVLSDKTLPSWLDCLWGWMHVQATGLGFEVMEDPVSLAITSDLLLWIHIQERIKALNGSSGLSGFISSTCFWNYYIDHYKCSGIITLIHNLNFQY